MSDKSRKLEIALASALAKELGKQIAIADLHRLTGGASRETWSFEAVDQEGNRLPLILRLDFSGGWSGNLEAMIGESAGLDRAGEYALFNHLYESRIPIPRPICLPDPSTGLKDCFIMERLAGEGRPRKILREEAYRTARGALTAELGDVLARIHRLDARKLPTVPVRSTEQQIETFQRLLALGQASRPVFELALRWLREHVPSLKDGPRLVHGDFRNGNFLVTPEGLRAVLDWEYAHLGDPMEDLGFLCMKPWRFGNTQLDVGGFGSRDELFSAYEKAGGGRVDPDAVLFWEVLGTVKWGALCIIRAMIHINGVQRSVEAAAIGRRVSETEFDLINLIG